MMTPKQQEGGVMRKPCSHPNRYHVGTRVLDATPKRPIREGVVWCLTCGAITFAGSWRYPARATIERAKRRKGEVMAKAKPITLLGPETRAAYGWLRDRLDEMERDRESLGEEDAHLMSALEKLAEMLKP